jgi:pyrroline-5-carboxylate reductase
MKTKSISFIGSGRVAAFMLEGFKRSGSIRSIILSDADPAVSAARSAAFPPAADAGADFKTAAAADIVFLALHPPVIASAAAAFADSLGKGSIVVSLAPKTPLASLEKALGTDRVARFLPNAPSAIGAGCNALTFGPGLDATDRAELRELLGALGEIAEVQESDIEAYAVLAAMGPTYIWPVLDELTKLGAEFGLSELDARRTVQLMAAGAAGLYADRERSYAALMDMIPAKPMADDESGIRGLFALKLRAMFAKLKS